MGSAAARRDASETDKFVGVRQETGVQRATTRGGPADIARQRCVVASHEAGRGQQGKHDTRAQVQPLKAEHGELAEVKADITTAVTWNVKVRSEFENQSSDFSSSIDAQSHRRTEEEND